MDTTYVNGYLSSREDAARELLEFRGIKRNRTGFTIVKTIHTQWLDSGIRYELYHSSCGPLNIASVEVAR